MITTLSSLLPYAVLGATNPNESVRAGRKALDRWLGSPYPWYDSDTDGVRRIDVSEPGDALDDIGDLSWPSISLNWLAWLVIAALLIGLIYLMVRTYRNRRRQIRADRAGPRETVEDSQRIQSLPFPVKAAQSDLLAEAREHYRQGNYGEAVKFLFSYQLVQLDKHQRICLTRGKTNRQYLREIGPRSPLRVVEQTMVAFEDFFFGNYTIDRARFESCWSRLEQFETLVGEVAG